MPVNNPNKTYRAVKPKWQRCRDAAGGTDAVQYRGTEYLPKLTGMDENEYAAYQTRALYYGATKRTIKALLGAIYRKEPKFVFPDEEQLETLSVAGETAWAFGQRLIEHLLMVGRVGLLVDVVGEGERAYISLYSAENIVNWDLISVNGQMILKRVVLRETYEVPVMGDAFDTEEKEQYRVLELVDGFYQQQLYRKATDSEEFKAIKEDERGNEYPLLPMRKGARLDFIPFQIINPASLTWDIVDPPLMELADVNLSHYRTSADLEHGAHYTALPTPWVAGFPTNAVLKIGSSVAWVTDNANGRAGFLEYTGQGLTALADLLESKERKMAILGARMLEEAKKAAEAADTYRMRLSGENGSLVSIARMASEGFTRALEWMAWWGNLTGDVTADFNTDFFDTKLTAQEMAVLMQGYQQGSISFETWIYNMERGEMLPPDTDAEIEYDRILNDMGRLPPRQRPGDKSSDTNEPDGVTEDDLESQDDR